jgi:enamine deaminase RidA (YjgF/YER057c/UK114 family)
MSRRLISSGSEFEKKIGYSRAAAGTISDDAAEQTRQTLKNIEAALKQADASFADVVRANYIIVNADDWPLIYPVLGETFGDIRPASTAIIAGLVDPRMKVEIEVTAKRKG